MPQAPIYNLDPSRVWPELPPVAQCTATAQRDVVGVSMAVAHVLSKTPFRGAMADLSPADFTKEIQNYCSDNNVDVSRLVQWAESILLPPEYTLPEGLREHVPDYMPVLGFRAHKFQVDTAAWAAARRGSVLALSCGTGKTFTAYAAAVAAARTGMASRKRLSIVAPLIAIPTWDPYLSLFAKEFEHVEVLSVDSMHKQKGADRTLGGALIVDEAHMVKDPMSGRTTATFDFRLGFDWAVAMTGTLLHAGPGGVIAVQDIACPGLSRFCDIWKFGEVFHCIVSKVVGRRTRRSIGMPPEDQFDAFVRYLNRGVKSLSFASPEVSSAVKLPGYTKTMVDTWPKPTWVLDLQREEYLSLKCGDDFDTWCEKQESKYIWLPECSLNKATAYLALAVQDEMKELSLAEQETREAEAMELNEASLEPVLPSFAKILMELCREGRYDRCIVRKVDAYGGASYAFQYAPGSSRTDPKPGVKVQFVKDWCDAHPDEPAVLSAVSSGGKEMLMKAFEGKEYRVIDGSVSKAIRGDLIKDFQAGKFQYMIVQQQAGSMSMTLTRAATSFLVDHAWSAMIYDQFLARTYRTSQERDCEHFDLVFGLAQMKVVATLARGCNFDAVARAELERLASAA